MKDISYLQNKAHELAKGELETHLTLREKIREITTFRPTNSSSSCSLSFNQVEAILSAVLECVPEEKVESIDYEDESNNIGWNACREQFKNNIGK